MAVTRSRASLLNAKTAAKASAIQQHETKTYRRLSHFSDRPGLSRHRTEADPHVHSGSRPHDRHRPQWVWEVELCRSAGSAVHGRQQALVGSIEDLEGRMAQPSSGASGGHRSRTAPGGARPRQSRVRVGRRRGARGAEGFRPAERQAQDLAAGARLERRPCLLPSIPFVQRARLDAG